MSDSDVIHLYVWSGDAQHARALAGDRYPGATIREFPHRKLRAGSLVERIRLLQAFRGRAVVFYFESLTNLRYRQIIECLHFFHRCRETVFCDSASQWQIRRSVDILRSTPMVMLSILCDVKTLLRWHFALPLHWLRAKPAWQTALSSGPEIVYLIPSPADVGSSGGAISHIRGVLNGLKSVGKSCRVFSCVQLKQDAFANEIVAAPSRTHFFWEAGLLAYNDTFARRVEQRIAAAKPRYLYQRHCRFSVAGALLSRRLRIPLILEYNGPEAWIAKHWDPTMFRGLLALCEEVTLRSAARVVVVSQALKAELLDRGIPEERILVNPNGVDAGLFYPGCGRERGRAELGIEPDQVLIAFVGSFSLWHGIETLQQAIVRLLSSFAPCRLRFVLIGSGLLHGEMRSALAGYEATGEVIFTGPVAHNKVAQFLDASDILVSPHLPMPDGSRFFGSPTKLFEYMAMGKAIVASRLEQIAEVLEHDRSAWLITPGSVAELSDAILQLALDPARRETLGAAARHAALERHSWNRNVLKAFGSLDLQPYDHSVLMSAPNGSIQMP